MGDKDRKIFNALKWIVEILEQHKIPFAITGGLAAIAYGATRPLNDIDIEIPDDKFSEILPDVKNSIVYGPGHYVDERWDLLLMTLNYNGQPIDISGSNNQKICDARNGQWIKISSDLSKAELREIFGMIVPVTSKQDLIEYKSMLAGEHQKQDIEEIKGN